MKYEKWVIELAKEIVSRRYEGRDGYEHEDHLGEIDEVAGRISINSIKIISMFERSTSSHIEDDEYSASAGYGGWGPDK
jgi:hypothetical protein